MKPRFVGQAPRACRRGLTAPRALVLARRGLRALHNWVNPRGQAGPMSHPIRTALQVAADPVERSETGARRAA